MKIGDKLKGKITGIKPYGAFVQLENGSIGLIHISEIKTGYIDNIYQTLSVGQEVLVQVVDYDEYSQKASLCKCKSLISMNILRRLAYQ